MTISSIGKKIRAADLGDDKGFTLLEILLVTVILATLVSIVTPRFRNSFDALQFKNFVLDLSATLHYAQDKAILEKDTCRASFTENPAGYRLEKAVGAKSKDGKDVDFHAIRDRAGHFKPLPQNISATIDESKIFLYPDGSVTDAHWVFKNPSGRKMGLRVMAESGDIIVEENND